MCVTKNYQLKNILTIGEKCNKKINTLVSSPFKNLAIEFSCIEPLLSEPPLATPTLTV